MLFLEHPSGMDDMVRAKVRMSGELFDGISADLPIPESALTPSAGRFGTDRDAWNPHATQNLRSGQVALDGARYLNVGVAREGDGSVTLFLMNHGT